MNLGWRDQIGSDFSYNVNLVLSDYVSKVITYNNPTKILSTYYEGQTIGEIWGYKTAGIIQTEEQLKKISDQSYIYGNWTVGDVEYKDLNNDGKIDKGKNTKDDHGDLTVIGNTTPRFSYGISLGAQWKGFDLNIFLQGVGSVIFVLRQVEIAEFSSGDSLVGLVLICMKKHQISGLRKILVLIIRSPIILLKYIKTNSRKLVIYRMQLIYA